MKIVKFLLILGGFFTIFIPYFSYAKTTSFQLNITTSKVLTINEILPFNVSLQPSENSLIGKNINGKLSVKISMPEKTLAKQNVYLAMGLSNQSNQKLVCDVIIYFNFKDDIWAAAPIDDSHSCSYTINFGDEIGLRVS